MIEALLMLLQADYVPACDQEKADQGIQQEMNICALNDFLAAEKQLNEQWAITSAVMKSRDESWKSEWDERPGYFNSLLASQRAWLKYRDAHCRVEGYAARGGSLEPLLVSTCKTSLTEARTQELRSLVEEPA